MKKMVLFFACLQASVCVFAQQNIGIRNSNYAGIQGALLNPSSIADSKLKWDVNVISAGEVFDNTFLYAPKKSLNFFGIKKIIDGSINENLFFTRYDANDPNKKYNVSFSTEILGPSFFVKIAKKHAIGFTMSARTYANIKDIPGSMAQNAFAYFKERDLWNTALQDNSSRINAMGWLQYGLHYATILYKDGRNEIKAGITINYLVGIAAAYTKNTHINYTIADTSVINFTNSSIEYGRTNSDDFKKVSSYHDINHGHGIGADIGFTYIHLKDDTKDYLYRLGVSVIDIGAINFNRNSDVFHLQANNAEFTNWDQSKFSGNSQLDRTLSAVFYDGDSARSLTASHFKMGLPAAFSVQFDWNVCNKFFANATIVKGIGHGNNPGVTRPDVYSLTPRYETKWAEISVPVSVLYYHHWQPRVGLAVRAGYFFIGGDAIGSLLKLNDLQGVDFYTGIHFFITEKRKKLTANN